MNKLIKIIIGALLAATVTMCVVAITQAAQPPPPIYQVRKLTCDKGVPTTYYGFNGSYHMGYCGKSITNTEWVEGTRYEIMCIAPMTLTVNDNTMECV